jgi:hypothetical protein
VDGVVNDHGSWIVLDKPEEVKKWQAERAKFIQKWTAW